MEAFTKYTRSWERPDAAVDSVTFNQWSGDHEPPSHSLPTSVAGKVAETFGAEPFHAFHFALMKAYFTDNRTVSDRTVILDVAAESGIDPDEFARRFDEQTQSFTESVIEDHNAAVGNGLGGVPAVLVNDEFPFTGAQELDFYERIVTTLAERGAAG